MPDSLINSVVLPLDIKTIYLLLDSMCLPSGNLYIFVAGAENLFT